MTVEEMGGSLGAENDRFPVGMRVLAVDDDPTCLKLLDGLLRKCQYQVTTTNQAETALKMLQENRKRFDLVISDVQMPDIDGFKLLELVGLGMDIPVIMLSSYGDTALVMKGITHGACDYLVKPVRIEELKNIWQHVLRRKKFESKTSNLDMDHQENGDGRNGHGPPDNANVKLNRKRKDEEEEEEDEENEDPKTQKKPRVVWSVELHGKFVAAVNQLGIEKAVPKRILDMMSVEGITRENVASHLQKYRLFLRRISSMEPQRANIVAALGGNDSSSMLMNSLHGLRDFRTFSGSGRFPNSGLPTYPTGGILGRLNSPAGMSLHNLSSSAVIQQNHAQNLSDSISSLGKPYSVISPANQNDGLFQRNTTLVKVDQFQQSKCASGIAEFNSAGVPTTFADNIVPVGSSNNSLTCASRNTPFLQGNPQQTQCAGLFGNQSTFKVTPLNSEPFNVGVSSSFLMDNGTRSQPWRKTIQQSKFSPSPPSLSEVLNIDLLPSNSLRNINSPTGLHIQRNPIDPSSTNTILAPIEDSRGEIRCRTGFVGDFLQETNLATDQRWGENQQGHSQNTNHVFSTMNSMVPSHGVMSPLGQVLDENYRVCNRKIDASSISQSNISASNLLQLSDIEKSAMDMDSQMRSSVDYHVGQAKLQGGFVHDGYDSLDDLMDAMIKRGQDGTELIDGEFGFDGYSF